MKEDEAVREEVVVTREQVAEWERKVEWWTCIEPGIIHTTTIEEAVEDWSEATYPEPLPETVVVRGFVRSDPDNDHFDPDVGCDIHEVVALTVRVADYLPAPKVMDAEYTVED